MSHKHYTDEMVDLRCESFATQTIRWPVAGRHILAQYDAETIVVYQAYRPEIGRFAAEHGYFGGEFSLRRMSWIKPNFLWMMYRSGWARKPGQEIVLAIWLDRSGFDEIIAAAVPSTHDTARYPDRRAWQDAVHRSDVRLQWDPDHGPGGEPLERRAIQLGLRGRVLASYARPWIQKIEDVTPFVRAQYDAMARGDIAALTTPTEHVYRCVPATAEALQLDHWDP